MGFKTYYQVKTTIKWVDIVGLYNQKVKQRKQKKRQIASWDRIFMDRDELKPGCKAEIQHPVKKWEQGIEVAHGVQRPVG